METLHTIIGGLIAVYAMALMIAAPAEGILEEIREYRKYKVARKELEFDERVWTSIAKSCDTIKDAEDRGYAIARLIITHHELEELEKSRQCS